MPAFHYYYVTFFLEVLDSAIRLEMAMRGIQISKAYPFSPPFPSLFSIFFFFPLANNLPTTKRIKGKHLKPMTWFRKLSGYKS